MRAFSVPLARSTSVLGIADPTGTLLPGEVHLAFSKGLPSEDGLETIRSLHGNEVLVARQPALRPSDIQKVRAVRCAKLEHVQDVIVFSSLGCIPLASKLQGGDYDGDTFWVCWEPDLVEDFMNAPAPLEISTPEIFGIRVDERNLHTILQEAPATEGIDYFFRKGFKFRLQPEILGIVTNMHERICYKYCSLNHPAVNILADLHDHLIDSAKSGYSYSEDEFRLFRNKHKSLRGHDRLKPAYKADIEDWLESRSRTRHYNDHPGSPEKEKLRARPNMLNVHDQLYFCHIKPHVQETLNQVRDVLNEDGFSLDEDLCQVYVQEHKIGEASSNSVVLDALDALGKSLDELRKVWKSRFTASKTSDIELFGQVLRECHSMFQAIKPYNIDEDTKLRWTSPVAALGPYSPTRWDYLKASLLAFKSQQVSQTKFLFYMCGGFLGSLKASQQESRLVAMRIWSIMKPRKQLPALTTTKSEDRLASGVDGIGSSDDSEDFRSNFEIN
jgi:hypothetical protein